MNISTECPSHYHYIVSYAHTIWWILMLFMSFICHACPSYWILFSHFFQLILQLSLFSALISTWFVWIMNRNLNAKWINLLLWLNIHNWQRLRVWIPFAFVIRPNANAMTICNAAKQCSTDRYPLLLTVLMFPGFPRS